MDKGQEKTLFVRKASGLRRDISVKGAIIITLANTAFGAYISYTLSDATLVFPGADYIMWIAILGPIITMLTLGIAFLSISVLMPRAGGPYVVLSRTITPVLGFLISWLFAIDMIVWMGLSAGYIATWTLPIMFTSMAAALNNPGLIDLMYVLMEPINAFIIGFVILIFCFLICMFGLRLWAKAVGIIWGIGIFGLIVGALLLFATPQANLVNAFNNIAASFFGAGPNYSETVVTAAKSYGLVWPVSSSVISGIKAMLTTGFGSFIYLYYGTSFVAGEIRAIQKSALYAILVGVIAFMAGSVLVAAAIMQSVGGEMFSSVNMLFTYGAPEYVFGWAAPPYWNFWASIATTNPFIIGLIAVSFFCWSIVWIPVGMLVFSRMVMAWSFDRLMPKVFADVSPKFRIPLKALTLATLISLVYLVLWISWPTAVYQFLIAMLLESTFLVAIGVACVVLPFKLKDLFEASPVKWKIKGVPVLSIAGVAILIMALARFGLYLTEPGWEWGRTTGLFIMYTVAVISGLVVFYGLRAYRKRKGVPIDTTYKEIPPE